MSGAVLSSAPNRRFVAKRPRSFRKKTAVFFPKRARSFSAETAVFSRGDRGLFPANPRPISGRQQNVSKTIPLPTKCQRPLHPFWAVPFPLHRARHKGKPAVFLPNRTENVPLRRFCPRHPWGNSPSPRGMAQLVAFLVWDQEVACSSHAAPTPAHGQALTALQDSPCVAHTGRGRRGVLGPWALHVNRPI